MCQGNASDSGNPGSCRWLWNHGRRDCNVFANAGFPVLLKDVDQAVLDLGMAKIQKNYAGSVQRGRFSQRL